MFRLFGSNEYEQQAYDELLAFLTQVWNMKERYARAFLDAYRRKVSKIHKDIVTKYDELRQIDDPELRLTLIATGGRESALAHVLIAQAYNAYKLDLRSGKHVGTDVELVIWAILSNRSDLLDAIDKLLGNYIRRKQEEKFPRLYEELFNRES